MYIQYVQQIEKYHCCAQFKQTNPPLLRNLGGGSFLGNVHDLQHVIVGNTIVFMPKTFGAVTKSSLAQAKEGKVILLWRLRTP